MILNVKELYLYVKRGDFMIGIIGAMDEEVAKIVEAMEIERQEDKACMSFKAGKLNG